MNNKQFRYFSLHYDISNLVLVKTTSKPGEQFNSGTLGVHRVYQQSNHANWWNTVLNWQAFLKTFCKKHEPGWGNAKTKPNNNGNNEGVFSSYQSNSFKFQNFFFHRMLCNWFLRLKIIKQWSTKLMNTAKNSVGTCPLNFQELMRPTRGTSWLKFCYQCEIKSTLNRGNFIM